MQDIILTIKIMGMIATLMKNTWAMKIIMLKKKKIIQPMIIIMIIHMDGMTSQRKKNWKVSFKVHMTRTLKMNMMSTEPEKENIH